MDIFGEGVGWKVLRYRFIVKFRRVRGVEWEFRVLSFSFSVIFVLLYVFGEVVFFFWDLFYIEVGVNR